MKTIRMFLLIFALVLAFKLSTGIAEAQISITDADAILERDLQSVNIPTRAAPLAGVFIINEDAVLVMNLPATSISTQAAPLANVFIINEDAVLVMNLPPAKISTQAAPLAELFVINQDAVLAKGLVSVNTGTQARPVREVFVINADAVLTRELVNLDGTTPPVGPSTTASFTLSLDDGLNMVSLPLRTAVSLTARSFAQQLAATMVIKYDTQQDEFVPFVPEVFSGDGFTIDGGQGYIVNMLNPRDVVFTGTAWSNAPPKHAPSAPSKEPHWAFVVCGIVYEGNGIAQDYGLAVTIENVGTGGIAEAEVGDLENGRYAAAFVDPSRKDVVNLRDSLRICLKDTETGATSKPIMHTVTPDDVMRGYVELPLRTESLVPEQSVLLQNYPNPFNPDTWIPYQLRQDSHVVIKIHTATGQLVRVLDLGYKNAGFYTTKSGAAYWDGRNEAGEPVASGLYFYTLKAGDFMSIKKMAIAK